MRADVGMNCYRNTKGATNLLCWFCFVCQHTRFLGDQIAVHGAPADVKTPGGLGLGAAILDEFHHAFAQIKAVCFHHTISLPHYAPISILNATSHKTYDQSQNSYQRLMASAQCIIAQRDRQSALRLMKIQRPLNRGFQMHRDVQAKRIPGQPHIRNILRQRRFFIRNAFDDNVRVRA